MKFSIDDNCVDEEDGQRPVGALRAISKASRALVRNLNRDLMEAVDSLPESIQKVIEVLRVRFNLGGEPQLCFVLRLPASGDERGKTKEVHIGFSDYLREKDGLACAKRRIRYLGSTFEEEARNLRTAAKRMEELHKAIGYPS